MAGLGITSYLPANPGIQVSNITSSTGTTTAVKLTDEFCFAFSGVATAFTAVIERMSRDLADGGIWVTIDTISGDASSAALVPNLYYEPGVAWYRVRLTALTGASVQVDLSFTGVGGGGL